MQIQARIHGRTHTHTNTHTHTHTHNYIHIHTHTCDFCHHLHWRVLVGREEHIFWLEVAVDDVLSVDELHALHDV
jgi:hypothetical protein